MGDRSFYIVDVFAEQRYAGNQLAVVTEAEGLDSAGMQRIAREMNFSETTFLLEDQERNGGFDVRIFTPREEVPFAGHPTLGTAWVIRNEILREPRPRIVLNLVAGCIPVTFDPAPVGSDLLWMHQLDPVFGETVPAETAAALLGLPLQHVDPRFPVQVVSTGIPFLIVPLKHIAATKAARIDPARYRDLVRNPAMRAVFLFCPEAEDTGNQVHARMFADDLGVAEDPATGSANGCLAGYLVQHRYLGSERIDLRVEQGYEMGRPSLLRIRAHRAAERIEVHVGGRVFLVARGTLLT